MMDRNIKKVSKTAGQLLLDGVWFTSPSIGHVVTCVITKSGSVLASLTIPELAARLSEALDNPRDRYDALACFGRSLRSLTKISAQAEAEEFVSSLSDDALEAFFGACRIFGPCGGAWYDNCKSEEGARHVVITEILPFYCPSCQFVLSFTCPLCQFN